MYVVTYPTIPPTTNETAIATPPLPDEPFELVVVTGAVYVSVMDDVVVSKG
jgi:hypothetical protein